MSGEIPPDHEFFVILNSPEYLTAALIVGDKKVIATLDGDDVTHVEGYRHYPAVIQAVTDALREQPQAMSLDIGDDGESGLDAIVLSIVNALPKEARIALDPPARPDRAERTERPGT